MPLGFIKGTYTYATFNWYLHLENCASKGKCHSRPLSGPEQSLLCDATWAIFNAIGEDGMPMGTERQRLIMLKRRRQLRASKEKYHGRGSTDPFNIIINYIFVPKIWSYQVKPANETKLEDSIKARSLRIQKKDSVLLDWAKRSSALRKHTHAFADD